MALFHGMGCIEKKCEIDLFVAFNRFQQVFKTALAGKVFETLFMRAGRGIVAMADEDFDRKAFFFAEGIFNLGEQFFKHTYIFKNSEYLDNAKIPVKYVWLREK